MDSTEIDALAKELDNQEKPIFMKPGHCAGDLVESYDWKVLKEEPGLVELDVHLPKHLLNPGVVINQIPNVHIQNLKPLPEANPNKHPTSDGRSRDVFGSDSRVRAAPVLCAGQRA